jgi:hypothetical protein
MTAPTRLLLCLSLAATSPLMAKDVPWQRHIIDASSKGADGVRLADANGDGLPDMATGWEQGGVVRVCLNPGPVTVKSPWPAVTVGQVRDVEDAVLVDLDGDGALDVVSACEGKERAMFVHWAPTEKASYLDATRWTTARLPAAANAMMWMFCAPLQVDQRHGVDLVAGGKNQAAALGWFSAPANARDLVAWQWHALREVGWLMSIVPADMDGDGDADIVFTDRKGRRSGCFWLENPGAGPAQTQPWKEHAIGGAGREVMFLHLADLDQDGLEDVLVPAKPRDILWFRRLDRTGKSWRAITIPQPDNTGTAKAVNVGDLDLDGKPDLVFSCEQAAAPRHGLMRLASPGTPGGGQWQAHPLSGVDGVKHDLIALVDLDQDGDLDVITTEEAKNLGVIWYENPAHSSK